MSEPPPGLIFSWRRERRDWALIGLVMASALFLGGTLLLFQVVYPVAKSVALTPQRLWLLDGSTPESRQVVAAAADRDFLIMEGSPTGPTLTELGQQMPVFTPSFKGRELTVKDFMESSSGRSTLPRIILPKHAPLPKRADPLPVAHVVPPRYVAEATVIQGLSGRRLLRPLTVPPSEPVPESDWSFAIAVGADGRVKLVAPLSDATLRAPMYSRLRAQLSQLRFEPRENAAVEWGTVAFRWREDKP